MKTLKCLWPLLILAFYLISNLLKTDRTVTGIITVALCLTAVIANGSKDSYSRTLTQAIIAEMIALFLLDIFVFYPETKFGKGFFLFFFLLSIVIAMFKFFRIEKESSKEGQEMAAATTLAFVFLTVLGTIISSHFLTKTASF
jgi:hypothetical protein